MPLANLNPRHREQSGCVICASPRSVTLTRRCSKSPRTRPTDPSSRKSSPPSLTSSSPTLVATWYRGSTAPNYVIPRSILWKHKLIDLHFRGAFIAFVLKKIVRRDYLSVKVWDLHMESKPIETFTVHEYLRSKLCSLYENDCIFDKFEVAVLTFWFLGISIVFGSAAGTGPTLLSWPAATTISLGGCWTSSHLRSPPIISVWMSSNSY